MDESVSIYYMELLSGLWALSSLFKPVISLKYLLILKELRNMSSGYATNTKVDRMDSDIKVQ